MAPETVQPRTRDEIKTSIAEMIAAGDATLAATPDNLWWNHDAAGVLNLAFPDWNIHTLHDPGQKHRRTTIDPHVLLTHREDPDLWFALWNSSHALLPERGSTMGQFFRFSRTRNTFAYGTAAEILGRAMRNFHPDSHPGLPFHLLDIFTANYPNGIPNYDAPTKHPEWALMRSADTNLRAARAAGTVFANNAERLAVAFPDYTLVNLEEAHERNRSRALLRSNTDTDQWMRLHTYRPTIIGDSDTVWFAEWVASGNTPRIHCATTARMYEVLYGNHIHWPTTTDHVWLTALYGLHHGDPVVRAQYAHEYAAAYMLHTLIDDDDPANYEHIAYLTRDPLNPAT